VGLELIFHKGEITQAFRPVITGVIRVLTIEKPKGKEVFFIYRDSPMITKIMVASIGVHDLHYSLF
jgi:hypothetical protein